jgi:hypothetical protein
MGVPVVHVFQPRGIADLDAPRQAGERVGEGIGARPPHPLEQRWQSPRVTGADEPEPAIGGRTEYEVMAPEEAESCGGMTGIERRDVGPDKHHQTWGAGFKRPAHADPEIARALPDRFYPAAPMTGASAGLVGRYRDPQAPAPVLRKTAQQQGDHRPLEAKRRNIADVAREPPFASSEQRHPHEQDQRASHQP